MFGLAVVKRLLRVAIAGAVAWSMLRRFEALSPLALATAAATQVAWLTLHLEALRQRYDAVQEPARSRRDLLALQVAGPSGPVLLWAIIGTGVISLAVETLLGSMPRR